MLLVADHNWVLIESAIERMVDHRLQGSARDRREGERAVAAGRLDAVRERLDDAQLCREVDVLVHLHR